MKNLAVLEIVFFFRQLVVFLQRKKIFPEDANYEIFLNDFDNKNMTNP